MESFICHQSLYISLIIYRYVELFGHDFWVHIKFLTFHVLFSEKTTLILKQSITTKKKNFVEYQNNTNAKNWNKSLAMIEITLWTIEQN